MVRLYDHPASGNCLKARMLLAHLGLPYERVHVDILAGEGMEPEHLARNPAGRTPVLELEDGEFLPESGAILLYLGAGTPYLPNQRLERARVWQWLFFEQNQIEPAIATARVMKWKGRDLERPDAYAHRLAYAEDALDSLERHLAGHDFLVAEHYTVADIALYAYTHVAHETGVDMSGRHGIAAWIERVESQPGFVNDLAPFP